MRPVDANTLNALSGSRSGESLTVYAWYGGQLSYPEKLNVGNARFSWDRKRQVQTMDLTIADPDGTMAPWLFDDPLGVGGARLQVRHDVGGANPISIGWYRITKPEPSERWRSYRINEAGRINVDSPTPNGKKDLLVSGGATIQIQASDLSIILKNNRLLAPESPKGANPTVIGEIRRLCGTDVPVVVGAGVVDQPVSRSLIYERDRLDAIQALCKSIVCDYRMNGDGQLEVYSLTEQTPVATLRGGAEGLLVDVGRWQELEGLYNTFVVDGTANNDRPVRAIAEITAGPLRVDGPHGRYATFYESNMISTENQARDYAEKMRDTHLAGLTVPLRVTCSPVPHLQQGDWVQVGNPVVNGQTASLAGMISSIDQPWRGTVPDRSTVTVECSYEDVQNVIGGIDRG